MSSQPPAYDEVIPLPPEPPSALVVQLQVWHYTSEGRSYKNNNRFAALFHDHNPQEWAIIPLEAGGVIGPSAHDQYVPVEVRFRHRIWAYDDPGEDPMADVRELFFKVAPQFVYQFFIQIQSTPHNLNIFPVDVPEMFPSRYTHAYMLNPLNIRVNAFIVPLPVAAEDVQSWLRDAVSNTSNVLKILAALVSLYLMYQRSTGQGAGISLSGIQDGLLDTRFFDVEVPNRLEELAALFQTLGTGSTNDDVAQTNVQIQEMLARAADPLRQYTRLHYRMDSKLRQLESNQRKSLPKFTRHHYGDVPSKPLSSAIPPAVNGFRHLQSVALSNQDLYELVQDVRSAALHLSTLKQTTAPLSRQLEEKYGKAMREYKEDRNTCGAAGTLVTVVALNLWNPVGWTIWAFAAAGMAAGVAGVVSNRCLNKHGEAFGKMDGVKELKLGIKELDECANQARAAIAMVFCSQVMQKRLSTALPKHHRIELLATLGVDVDALSNPIYNEELICDRLRRFREGNKKMLDKMKTVYRDADFEIQTTEEAE